MRESDQKRGRAREKDQKRESGRKQKRESGRDRQTKRKAVPFCVAISDHRRAIGAFSAKGGGTGEDVFVGANLDSVSVGERPSLSHANRTSQNGPDLSRTPASPHLRSLSENLQKTIGSRQVFCYGCIAITNEARLRSD